MKHFKILALLAALLAACASVAWADRGHHHHGHAHFGIFIGPPLIHPWYYPPSYYYYYYYPPSYYYPPPYYYYPAPAVPVPSAPPTYVEQGSDSAPPPASYWYHCDDPQGYYPYVKNCPGGWQREVPHAPPS